MKKMWYLYFSFTLCLFIACDTGTITDTVKYTFTEHNLYAIPRPLDIEFSDIDNDGNIDVIYCDDDKEKLMLLRNTDETFTNEIIIDYFPGAGSIAGSYRLQDYNNDGYMDIIANINTELTISENDGSASFINHSIFDFSGSGYLFDSYCTDLNNNNSMDIISTVDAYFVYYMKTEGNYSITEESVVQILNYGEYTKVQAEDIDSDGDIDLITHTMQWDNISIWLNDGTMNFTEHKIFLASASDYAFAKVDIADLDKDGDWDLVGILDANFVWWEQLSDHSFEMHSIPTEDRLSSKCYILDFDNDEDNDIVFLGGNSNSDIILIKNNGYEEFTQRLLFEDSSTIEAFNVVDYDEDGDNDILIITNFINNNGLAYNFLENI